MKRNNNNKYGYKQQQKQVNLVAHDKILVFENFRYLMEGLEEYVEKSGYYPNFKNKRQLRNITVPREKSLSVNNCEELFRTRLLLFLGVLGNDTPDSTRKEVQEEYYKWINIVGIDANNCLDEKLKHFLIETNNVIEGKSEKIVSQTQEHLDSKPIDLTDPNEVGSLIKVFSSVQGPMDEKREQAKLYKDKNYFQVEVENKFSKGNSQQGEQTFKQLTGSVSTDDFHFFKQKDLHPTNFNEVVREVKTNPQNWTFNEIATEINRLGWAKKQESAVYCRHARLDDYNQEGKLNFNNNPIYLWESFDAQQRFEIKRAKNLSGDYLTNEEIKWVVKEVKDNPGVWRIELIRGQTYLIHNSAEIKDNEVGTLIHNQQKFSELEWAEINSTLARINDIKQNAKLEKGLFVINRETGEVSENEDWFIHNQLKRECDNRTGYLVYVPDLMIRAKDLNEAEQKAVGYKSETTQQTQTIDNRPQGGGGGFWGSKGSIYGAGSFAIISLIGLAFTR